MVEIYIRNGFLLTMQGEGLGTIEEGAIAIENSNIVAVGKTADLDKNYKNSDQIIDAKGKAVLPGFVDVHIHTSGTITRGQGQDVPEIEWMLKTMGPFGKYTKPEHSIAGSKLGVLEGLKSGVTTFGEIGGNTIPVTEKVFIPSGVRATVANSVNEIGPDSRPDANKPYIFYPDIGEKKLKDAIVLYEKMDKKGDGRINVIFAPHGADFMSKETLFKVKSEAIKRGKLSHMHVAQGGREAIQIKLRYGTTTIKWLDSIGFLDENLIAAHCHHSTDEEVEILAKRGVRYASCPASIGIIDGIVPPLALFIQKGGKYAGLGSDQAAGSTGHNMLIQLKAAALLNKARHADPSILPSWKTLRIATIEGAQTLGLGEQTGSLEEGKKADITIIDLKYPHLTPIIKKPVRNVAPNLVYYARGDEVETVICNGKIIVENHICTTMNEEKVMEDAQKAAEEVCNAAVEDYMAADSLLAKAVKKGLL
jgi:5-methylthioadenosine/S-adenosylhomocysteine deaminase